MTQHGPILACLTFLFALRVLGQMLVAFLGVTWLPPMEQWSSGLIPYPPLLAIQLFMLLVMIHIVRDVWRGHGYFSRTTPNRAAQFLIAFSAVYAAAMVLRYVVTMSLRPEMRWASGTIPIFFHFVLAGFIFTLGHSLGAKKKDLEPSKNG